VDEIGLLHFRGRESGDVVPCAFSSGGLPIGLQIVGRHHDDWGVLQLGYAF